jgi:hypothetical protein
VVGFRITVNKAIAIVQLLKGEIPPRSMFTQKPARLREALQPYMELTQAVRNGDLSRFKAAAEYAPSCRQRQPRAPFVRPLPQRAGTRSHLQAGRAQ